MRATERNDPLHESYGRNPMVDQDAPDSQFESMTSRLLRREALRRAAEELSTMTGPGLENALARLST
jgi:phage shock protein A